MMTLPQRSRSPVNLFLRSAVLLALGLAGAAGGGARTGWSQPAVSETTAVAPGAGGMRMPEGFGQFIGQLQSAVHAQDPDALRRLVANPAAFAPSFGPEPVASLDQWLTRTPMPYAVLDKAIAFGCAPVGGLDGVPDGVIMLECPGYGEGDDMNSSADLTEADPADQVLLVDGPAEAGQRAQAQAWLPVDTRAISLMSSEARQAMETLTGQVPVIQQGAPTLLPSSRVVLPIGYRVMVQKSPQGWALRSVVSGD